MATSLTWSATRVAVALRPWSVLCRKSRGHAYSGVGRSFQEIPTYSWSVNVVTHEIGHNLGSRHTHDCVWNGNATAIDRCGIQAGYGSSSSCNSSAPIPPAGTVMSYCHLVGSSRVDLALGFGDQPGDLIRDRVYNADCLVPCDPAPEVCDDNFDNDFDGLTDCEDPDCDQFVDCLPCMETIVNVFIQFDETPVESYWNLRDDTGSIVEESAAYTSLDPNSTITQELCLGDGCYTFTFFDSGGNGLCCNFGDGFFQLINEDGTVIAQGDQFSNAVTTEICDGIVQEDCFDRVDNDLDGLVDCEDPDCDQSANCRPCDDNLVIFEMNFNNFPQETSWEIIDERENVIIRGQATDNTQPRETRIEQYCLEDGCYSLIVYDSGGNGLCCNLGAGGYSLINTLGAELASGDVFGSVDITEFCVGGGESTCQEGTTFVVSSAGEGQANNLRQAIYCANGSAILDTIVFDLEPGEVIVLDEPLPVITDANIYIDGGGSTEISYTGTGALPFFQLDAPFTTIRDVIISAPIPSNAVAVLVSEASNNVLLSNNEVNGFRRAFSIQAPNAVISDNSISSEQMNTAIQISATSGNVVVTNNTVLGDGDGFGLWTDADDIEVQGNEMAFLRTGIRSNRNNDMIIAENVLHDNRFAVEVLAGSGFGGRNFITENSMYCNTETEVIALDPGANANIQPPVVTELTAGYVAGTAVPGQLIEVYLADDTGCDDAPCQGKTYISTTDADGDGVWYMDELDLTGNERVVAIASDLENNSSAFSECYQYVRPCPNATLSWTPDRTEVCEGSSVTFTVTSDVEIGTTTNFTYRFNGVPTTITDYTIGEPLEISLPNSGNIVLGSAEDSFGCELGVDRTFNTIFIVPGESVRTERSESICPGSSIIIDGEEVSEPGMYQETFTAANGCDSIVDIILAFTETIETSELLTLCTGESAIIHGETVNTSGVYPQTYTTDAGCDSIHTVTVDVLELISTEEALSICAGESVEIFGNPETEAGEYTEVFTASNNCDSLHTIVLTVTEPIATAEERQICTGETTLVFGQLIGDAGDYPRSFLSAAGCDSTHTVTVIVNEEVETTETISICAGSSIEIFGQTQTETGNYSGTFTSSTGCDSTHTVSLQVVDNIETSEDRTICAGESALIFGNPETEAGQYMETFVSITGCDSTHTVELMVIEPLETRAEVQLCAGQSVEIFGETITEEGAYAETFLSASGCDSTHTVVVSVAENIETNASVSICAGESVDIFGETVSEGGIYSETFTSSSGCDSTHQITLVVNEPLATTAEVSICAGSSVEIFGIVRTEAGEYSETFLSSTGCDSTHTVVLGVAETIETSEMRQACVGDEVEIFGQIYTSDATPNATFVSSSGCDSTHTVALRFVETIETSARLEGCDGQSVEVFGEMITEAGPYSETFTSSLGCDSTHTIIVTFSESVETSEELQICAGSTVEIFGEEVTEAGEYEATFASSTGCDSTHTVVLSVLESLETEASLEICAGESVEIFGEEVSTAGPYSETFISSTGCDSTHTVVLSLLEASESFNTLRICAGESVEIFGESQTEANLYAATFVGANGCDSIAQVELIVREAPEVRTTVEGTCAGEASGSISLTAAFGTNYSYTWGHTTATTSTLMGLPSDAYTVTVTDDNGCSNVLSLTVPEAPLPDYELEIVNISCGGAADGSINLSTEQTGLEVALNRGPFSTDLNLDELAADTYTLTVRTADGCTSSEEITLTADEEITIQSIELESPDCAGDQDGSISVMVNGDYSYNWNTGQSGSTLTGLDAGTYTVTISGGSGCSLVESIELPGATTIDPNLVIRSGCGEGEIIAVANPDRGAEPYELNWSTGASGNIIAGLVAGQYRLTITDANDCELVEDFTVPLVSPFRVSHQTTDASCADSDNGVANLVISGGVEPYDISWSNGATDANLMDLAPGTYTYNVSSDGCARAGQVVIDAPAPLGITVEFTPGPNGNLEAVATATGGRNPYAYQWGNGLTGRTLSGILPSTELTIEVLDANNCSFTTTVVATLVDAESPGAEQIFRLFPNPTGDALTIELVDDNPQAYNLRIYTAAGVIAQEWQQVRGPQQRISMRSLPAGVYFVAFQRDGQRWVQRVVVVR
jgi:hypothetical protein